MARNALHADGVIPISPIQKFLEEVHRTVIGISEGEVATYIPQLARADPEWFGICVATANGSVYEVGDTGVSFTIQSISKPLVYGIALEEHGRTEVLGKIGVEPTGDAFNSISLDPQSGCPKNPMINAGAIAATGFVSGHTEESRFERILAAFGAYAGRDLEVDEAVFQSESETGHRNRAIGHMLRNFDILDRDPSPTLSTYFRQCAISVTCRDLAVTAATLANRGVNPLTGKQALRGEYVESVLSVMGSCGMYDYAGEWIYRVGMPAKSGVSGGIIAVLPGQLGIGVFSPRLDARGNSVRGIKVCDALSRHLDLHLFNHPRAGKSVIRARFDGTQFNSRQVRTAAETVILRENGAAIRGLQLQGDISFSTGETVVTEIMKKMEGAEWVVLDFKRALEVNESACLLFCNLAKTFRDLGRSILFTNVEPHPLLRRIIRIKMGRGKSSEELIFVDNDRALEQAENELLGRFGTRDSADRAVDLDGFELFAGLAGDDLRILARKLKRRQFSRGEIVVQIGASAESLFLLARGQASAVIERRNGGKRRLAAFRPGMAFGEMAAIEMGSRSATVIADSEVECEELSVSDLDELARSHPGIYGRIMQNLARELSRKLRQANCERAVLDE